MSANHHHYGTSLQDMERRLREHNAREQERYRRILAERQRNVDAVAQVRRDMLKEAVAQADIVVNAAAALKDLDERLRLVEGPVGPPVGFGGVFMALVENIATDAERIAKGAKSAHQAATRRASSA
jgi:hypothetical protein